MSIRNQGEGVIYPVKRRFYQILISTEKGPEVTKFKVLTTTWACNWESFILYFHPEISRAHSFLRYSLTTWREQDGIIAKDLWYSKLNWGGVFVDVAVADLNVPNISFVDGMKCQTIVFFFFTLDHSIFLSQKSLLFFPLMSENERRTFLFENEALLKLKLRPH